MITFLICLALLITAYFTYGKFLERIIGVKNNTEVPSKVSYDGVDYIPLPRWKIFLIQLLNIAGLGPIFGAILGAAYGPVAFLWITLGGIFMGAMHDFLSGYMSLKNNGCSLHQLANLYLGKNTKIMMSLFTGLLMIMVGAVFMSQPAVLINNLIHYENPFFTTVAIDNNAGSVSCFWHFAADNGIRNVICNILRRLWGEDTGTYNSTEYECQQFADISYAFHHNCLWCPVRISCDTVTFDGTLYQ